MDDDVDLRAGPAQEQGSLADGVTPADHRNRPSATGFGHRLGGDVVDAGSLEMRQVATG